MSAYVGCCSLVQVSASGLQQRLGGASGSSLNAKPAALRVRTSRSAKQARRGTVVAEAEYRRGGDGSGFFSGFLLGGLVFGTLGFVFAPHLSRTILGENADGSPRRLPRWMEEEDNLEATRRNLNEKIAQLNAAIDDVSAQLRADDRTPADASVEPMENIV